MLNTVKLLLNIPADDTAKDAVLTHFLEQARLAACVYCNVDVLPEAYDGTVCSLAAFMYKHRDTLGIQAQKQGERSVTFDNDFIPKHIRAALPLPRVRVVGDV